jgi:hypothetical protein
LDYTPIARSVNTIIAKVIHRVRKVIDEGYKVKHGAYANPTKGRQMEQPIYLTPTLGDRMRDAYWAKHEALNLVACAILAVSAGWFGMGFLLSL